MRILLASIGSRGDMEPLLALGEKLKARGHTIQCLFPEQFEHLAKDMNFSFSSIGPEFIQMLESPEGKAALGGSGKGLKKILAYIRVGIKFRNINKSILKLQKEHIDAFNPDLILHNAKVIYAVLWSIKTGGKALLNSPVPYIHYVKGHSHLAFNANYGILLNKLTFALARFGLVKTTWASAKTLGMQKDISKALIKEALNQQATVYTISPSLFNPPKEWPNHLQVVGYYKRNQQDNWKPEPALTEFLKQHQRVLFLTFGSMTNPKPEYLSTVLLKVLAKHKIPTLVNTSSGGLVQPQSFNSDLFYFVSDIPYDWVMKRVYAAVHHGGSGTTHMVANNGCASLIIPHIIDQFVWNKLMFEKGIGPLGPSIGQLNARTFESAVLDLWNTPAYKNKAVQLGEVMQYENHDQALVNYIEHYQETGKSAFQFN